MTERITNHDLDLVVRNIIDRSGIQDLTWTKSYGNHYRLTPKDESDDIVTGVGISNFYHRLDAIDEFLRHMRHVKEARA